MLISTEKIYPLNKAHSLFNYENKSCFDLQYISTFIVSAN